MCVLAAIIWLMILHIISMLIHIAWSYITMGHGPIPPAGEPCVVGAIAFPWINELDAWLYGRIDNDLYHLVAYAATCAWFVILTFIIIAVSRLIGCLMKFIKIRRYIRKRSKRNVPIQN